MKFFINTIIVAIFLAFANLVQAQTTTTKSDFFDSSGKIFVAVAVLAVIFIGILIMMISIERRLAKIEKEDGDI
jgi:uncharacterized membrane protein